MKTLVFWIDVDNTLLANDEVKATLDAALQADLGLYLTTYFWEIYEQVRKERGVVDIPLSLERLREQVPSSDINEETYRHIHSLFDNYPFVQALYPHVLETLHYLSTIGLTVIVSDGDIHFQAEKIINSALAEAVEGRVLLFTHKQQHLEEIIKLYPAEHYAMIDDKPAILSDTKKLLGAKVTTVFVRQGKYAAVPLPEAFVPEVTVDHIADLLKCQAAQFFI